MLSQRRFSDLIWSGGVGCVGGDLVGGRGFGEGESICLERLIPTSETWK